MSIKLFQHNQEVYDAILDNLITNNKVAVVQATGTGKGVIATKLIFEAFSEKNILIVAPTNAILTNYIVNHNVDINTVKLVSYKKLASLSEEQLIAVSKSIAVMFLDEFHRTGAPKWGRAVDFLVGEMLKRNKKIIGLSATPIRYLDNARNMADELFEGNVIQGVDLEEAIEKDILPTFKYVVSLYGYDEDIKKIKEKIKEVTDEKKLKKLQEPVKRLQLIKQENKRLKEVITKETKDLGENQKWIIFCNDIVELDKVKKIVPLWFENEVNIYTMNSGKVKIENEQTLEVFNAIEKGCNILLCVNMLNEGVHVKGISGVIMLRKTISPIIFMQQLGRALEAGNSKQPIIFDFIGNYRKLSAYKSSEYLDIQRITKNINSRERQGSEKRNNDKIVIQNYVEDLQIIISRIENILNSSKLWSEEEDAILRKYYPVEGPEVYKRLEDRTKASCKTRARFLGVKVKGKELINTIPWSEIEENILRKYFPEEGPEVYKRLKNRTKSSCAVRASVLGIKRIIRVWTDGEDNIIRKYFPIEGTCVYKRLDKRTETSCLNRAKELGISKIRINAWKVQEDEIILTYFPTEGSEVHKRLEGRTETSCVIRAKELGLNVIRVNAWKGKEDEIIRKYYPEEGSEVYRRLDGRTKVSCQARAVFLGVKLLHKQSIRSWKEQEDEVLRTYYPQEGSEVYKRLSGRTESACKNRATKLGLVVSRRETQLSNKDKEIIRNFYLANGIEGIKKLLD